ncbi:uncharacterized protein LOC112691976 isoform X2 [Sipha flava]|uniref:Uncharacterized protein LOC112691976 isoform X2 n=1 Tax=Sipha flava TaxID=143950 RepID=A0A8B8GI98_9HEMI|nr:uncharacterized protein LOC112691976 isoform X2 [Sipha flava]
MNPLYGTREFVPQRKMFGSRHPGPFMRASSLFEQVYFSIILPVTPTTREYLNTAIRNLRTRSRGENQRPKTTSRFRNVISLDYTNIQHNFIEYLLLTYWLYSMVYPTR